MPGPELGIRVLSYLLGALTERGDMNTTGLGQVSVTAIADHIKL